MPHPADGPAPSPTPHPEDRSRHSPVVLRVAGTVAVVQGGVTLVLGVVETFSLSGDRLVMGATTAVFFAAYGALLAVAGAALWRPARWARGPVLAAQLVWLGVAWSLHSGSATWLGVVLAVSAVLCLVMLLQPAAVQAVDGDRYAD